MNTTTDMIYIVIKRKDGQQIMKSLSTMMSKISDHDYCEKAQAAYEEISIHAWVYPLHFEMTDLSLDLANIMIHALNATKHHDVARRLIAEIAATSEEVAA